MDGHVPTKRNKQNKHDGSSTLVPQKNDEDPELSAIGLTPNVPNEFKNNKNCRKIDSTHTPQIYRFLHGVEGKGREGKGREAKENYKWMAICSIGLRRIKKNICWVDFGPITVPVR